MAQSTDVVSLLIATIVLVLLFVFRRPLTSIPFLQVLVFGFLCMYAGIVLNIAEDFILPESLNVLEHLLYLGSDVLLVVWILLIFRNERARQ